MKGVSKKDGDVNVRRSVHAVRWKQSSLLPFLESTFTWTSCYLQLNCSDTVSMGVLHRLASLHTPASVSLHWRGAQVRVHGYLTSVLWYSAVHLQNPFYCKTTQPFWMLTCCAHASAKFKMIFYLQVSTGILVCRVTLQPWCSFAMVSVYAFVLSTLKFLSRETSGIFVNQIMFVSKLCLPVLKPVCFVTGVVCFSCRALGSIEPSKHPTPQETCFVRGQE